MRRKQKQSVAMIVVFLLFGIVQPINAQGLLGKRYTSFSIGIQKPGDDYVKQVDDSILQLGGQINLPVNSNVDANFTLSYEQLDGDDDQGLDFEGTSKSVVGGVVYHFTPDQKINPFVGVGVGFVSVDIEATAVGFHSTSDETDLGFSLVTGIEIDLNSRIAIRPTLGYYRIENEYNDDDFTTGVSFNVWFNNSVFGGIRTTYALDEGDVTILAGLGLGF